MSGIAGGFTVESTGRGRVPIHAFILASLLRYRVYRDDRSQAGNSARVARPQVPNGVLEFVVDRRL
ncbi:MAG TPA: hypothetical protein VFS66_11180 [Acidimicrobiia bacterium]|nr:hypothetical protein [Acidimicrobiia bacterium]